MASQDGGPPDRSEAGAACRSSYQGDGALRGLLDKHGVSMTIEAVRGLLAGVNAASVDRSDAGWVGLIAPTASPALAAQLTALRAELAAAHAPAPAIKPITALRAEL